MDHDNVMPDGAWAFDEEVTDVFDDMLARSIPQYEVMRRAVYEVGQRFVEPGTEIMDLGCSRGEAIAPFVSRFGALNHYTLVEVSEPMLEATRQRYRGWIDTGIMDVLEVDLREDFPHRKASLTLSVLTLMFVPIERRQKLVRNIYRSLEPGGALVLVEKVLGATAEIDELMVELYYNRKRENGYTEAQIERKRLSLQGVLVPVTAAWNEELLRMAGFGQVDAFWRWMNFQAWVAVKEV